MKLQTARTLCALIASLIPVDAAGQTARYLICTFPSGVVTDLSGSPTTEPSTGAPLLLIFRDVDMASGVATVVGNASPEGVQVAAIEGANSFSFVETTPSGNVNTTSVFPNGSTDVAVAVTSRHIAIPGGVPVISQLFGSCRRG